jgi:1-acyl-sn-glycerol-3-phosphate acyltransferase
MGRVRTLRRVHDLLATGTSVLNFPEGTTTRGDRVEPFWRGTFGIAQRLGIPVVPFAIRYADPAMAWCDGATFVPHYLDTASRTRVDVSLAFAPPMWPRAGEPPEAMAERARRVITQLLGKDLNAGTSSELHPSRPDPILSPAVDTDRTGKRGGRRTPRRAA